ncbi:MAG: hypothetical protein GF390_00010 [Candidatus Pacebacteria bacterium]|nr:hypothetical protein [Candidatus Paceibacterota bacterium]
MKNKINLFTSHQVLTDKIYRYYLFVFLKNLSFFAAVTVPFFMDWGGLAFWQISLTQSWFSFWLFVLEIPTGAVADYLGRKHSIALGALVVAVAALIYGSIPNFYVFLMAEFFFTLAGLWPNYLTVGLFVILAGGFGLTRLTYMTAQMQEHISSRQRATVLSSVQMFRRFVLVFLNPFIGLLVDRSLSLAVILVGLIPLLIFGLEKPKKLLKAW